MVKGWFCHDCLDDIGNNVKGLGNVPSDHKGHAIQTQPSMTKCSMCPRLSGGYREGQKCYNPNCEGKFKLIQS